MSSGTSYSTIPSPITSFISVKIGDNIEVGNYNLSRGSRDPQAITSFRMTKLNSMSSTFTAEDQMEGIIDSNVGALFSDATFSFSLILNPTLENDIVKYLESVSVLDSVVKFRYGYVNGLRSQVYTGIVSSISLSDDMYTLNMKLSHRPAGSRLTNIYLSTLNEVSSGINSGKYTRYSDVVGAIAKSQGWTVGAIVKTKKVSKIDVYPDVNDTISSYIHKIIPNCVSEEGEGDYKSEFKYDRAGNEVYYFRPSSFLVSGSNYKISKNYNFVYGMLPNGNVISFSPNISNGTALALENVKNNETDSSSGTDSNLFGVISKDTKELVEVGYDIGTSYKNTRDLINPSGRLFFTDKSSVNINSSIENIDNYTESIIKDDISKHAYSVGMNSTAKMQILGDPELQLMNFINVLPMYPARSRTSGAIMHPTGGTYRIMKITESIASNGFYTTSLELTKENNTLELSKLSNKSRTAQVDSESDRIEGKYKVGEIVKFTGTTYYVGPTPTSVGFDIGSEQVVKIHLRNDKYLTTPGAHPYYVRFEGEWKPDNNIDGWVNESELIPIPPSPEE